MTLRTFYLALTAVALSLLVSGLGLFVWLWNGSPLRLLNGSRISEPAAAMFVPKQAPLMTSLLVAPQRLQALSQVVTPTRQRSQVDQEWQQLQDALLTGFKVDFVDDIAPWLGDEVTFAVTSLDRDRDSSNGRQPGYLVAFSTQDGELARQALQRFWQDRAATGTQLVFETYKGVKLIYGDSALVGRRVKPLATAVFGDRFLLAANDPKVLREAINNAQVPDLNLQRSESYQRALQSLHPRRLGLLYADLDNLGDWLNERGLSRKAEDSDRPNQFQGLTLSLALNKAGILADTALIAKEPLPSSTLTQGNRPSAALRYLPADSRFVLGSHNLAGVWQELQQRFGDYPAWQELQQQLLATVQQQLGLNLQTDVIDWIDGDYALGQSGDDWIFAVDRRQTAASSGIEQLDAIASDRGYTPTNIDLDGHEITAWTQLRTGSKRRNLQIQATVRGGHGRDGNFEVFATSLDRLASALEGRDSLLTSPEFRQAQQQLPQPNQGVLYLDWQASALPLTQRWPVLQLIALPLQPLLEHVQAIAIASPTPPEDSSDLQRLSIELLLRS
ncbi:DUF3352 domain-containing protein [Synechococcus elongatus]|uniref:DUF3352 domain-containing protein n=1 Tax=Synechococcus elongatus TaxID=32046 RepID=UPI0030D0FAC1